MLAMLVVEEEGRVGVEISVAFKVVDAGGCCCWVVAEEAFSSASVRRAISSWADLRNSCIDGTVVSRGTSPMGGKVEGRSLYGFGIACS